MKAIVVVVVIVALCAGGYYYFRGEAGKDRGMMMGWGFTKPDNGKCELNVEIDKKMIEAEPPPGWPDAVTSWPDWVKKHFQVRDSSGQIVAVDHLASSRVASDHAGSPVMSYMGAKVQVGQEYTVEYIPVSTQPARYQKKVTVPSDEQFVKSEYWMPAGK